MRKKTLLIIGMHRSGTSLLTQWLQRCGLAIGEELMIANSGNEQGYFEDMDFVRIHEDILFHQGLPSTGLTDKPLPVLRRTDKEMIRNLLETKSLRHTQWAWKDPRTCLFLPVYRELVPEADYLVIHRDFRFCVYSLINRMIKDKKAEYLRSGKFKASLRWKWYKRKKIAGELFAAHTEEYLKVWIRYNKEILQQIELLGAERCPVLNYQTLLSIDGKLFDILTSKWGYRLDYIPFREVYSKELMSPQAPIDTYIHDKKLVEEAAALTARLNELALR
jgi:hypothetical protein